MKYSHKLSDAVHILAFVSIYADGDLSSGAIAASIEANQSMVRQMMAKLVKAGLLTDMTPYMSGMKYIKQYSGATDSVTKLANKKGIWGINSSVSANSPTTSAEGLEPTTAPYIRWDIYKELGYPKIKNTDDLINVLKKMQARARKDEGKTDIYAISLFKDTPFLFAITVVEMVTAAQQYGARNFQYLEPITIAGVIFLLASYPTSILIRRLEKTLVY